jgi:hypothetical protein
MFTNAPMQKIMQMMFCPSLSICVYIYKGGPRNFFLKGPRVQCIWGPNFEMGFIFFNI